MSAAPVRTCWCGSGVITGHLNGDHASEGDPPSIDCDYCSEVFTLGWFLCWDPWEGTYWYAWKRRMSV